MLNQRRMWNHRNVVSSEFTCHLVTATIVSIVFCLLYKMRWDCLSSVVAWALLMCDSCSQAINKFKKLNIVLNQLSSAPDERLIFSCHDTHFCTVSMLVCSRKFSAILVPPVGRGKLLLSTLIPFEFILYLTYLLLEFYWEMFFTFSRHLILSFTFDCILDPGSPPVFNWTVHWAQEFPSSHYHVLWSCVLICMYTPLPGITKLCQGCFMTLWIVS